ncbi:hypothetical protein AAY473_012145 [Plecturocebus cupreus]
MEFGSCCPGSSTIA